MGKTSRKLRRRLIQDAFRKTPSNDLPQGGYDGVISRYANGQTTVQDLAFIDRVRLERQGRNGYTGEPRGSIGEIGDMGKGKKKDIYTFQTSFNNSQEDGVFKCADSGEVTEKCPLNPKVPRVYVPALMWETFIHATKAYDCEWIALLFGKLGKNDKGDDSYIIEKFYFPPQVASGAHVEVPTGVRPRPGVIGAIHSHVGMGAFWSQTDKDHSNWPVEIVVNRKAECKALVRYKLKCGEWAKGDSEVWLEGAALNPVIKKELDNALAKGSQLMAEARKLAAAASTSKGDKGVTTTIIPPSIAKEDREDVADAILCECGCPAIEHYNFDSFKVHGGWVGGCRKCKPCMRFSVKGPNPTLCPLKSISGILCNREIGHLGMCKSGAADYFSPVREVEIVEEKVIGEERQLGFPPFDGLVPIQDDPTYLGQDLDEWDCKECQGHGWVESDKVTKECPSCGGSGLSPKGKDEEAKELSS